MPVGIAATRLQFLLAGLAWLALSSRLPGQSTTKPSVYVLSVSGAWQSPTLRNPKLSGYETLHVGDPVSCSGKGKLELLLGSVPYTVECPAQAIAAPSGNRVPTGNTLTAFGRAMQSLLTETPRALPRPAAVRSLASPADSVLCLGEDGALDVASAILALKPRRYRLEFGPLSQSAGSQEEIEVAWSGQAPAKVNQGAPKPGLYRLEIVAADGAESTMGTWAIVRIAPAAACQSDTQALQQAREIAARANPPLSDEGARSLYFLTLSSMERQ